MIRWQQLTELDFENVGEWPFAVKMTILGFVFATLVVIGYIFDSRIQSRKSRIAVQQEQELKRDLENKYKKLANLRAYTLQNKAVRQALEQKMVHLPKSIDVSSFIADISKFGQAYHLEFKLLKPMLEVKNAFYVSIPIKIEALGNYHNFALFIEQIVKTDYALSFRDIEIKRVARSTVADRQLFMKLTIDLFRYVDVKKEKKRAAAATS